MYNDEQNLYHYTYRKDGTELLCISKMRLKRLLNEHPAIGVKLLQCFLASLSEKITHANEQRREMAAYDYNAVEIPTDI